MSLQGHEHIKLQNNVWLFSLGGEVILSRAGKSINISDVDGFIYTLLKHLDGTTSLTMVYEQLPEGFRGAYSLSDVLDVLRQLDEFRVLEDSGRSSEDNALLDDYSRSRWSRNLEFFNAYCTSQDSKIALQKRVADTKVTLLGLGGLGSHALFDLVSLGFTKITAVDFDKVELSNLNRQILYTEKDIGRLKVDAARDTISRYIEEGRHDISFHNVFLDGWTKVYPFVETSDIVISCVDRPSAVMEWVNEACVRASVPLVAGGLDTVRTCTYTVLPGRTGCVECWRRREGASSARRRELMELGLAVDVMKLPPRAAPVHLVAVEVGLMVAEALKIVTGIASPAATNRLMQYDFASMTLTSAEEWSLDPTCPVCRPAQAQEAA